MYSMDKHDAIDAVSENALEFIRLPDEMKANRDVVMATVITRGFMLEHVGHFKDDQIVVMAALSNGGDFSEASQRLQKDPRMIEFAIEHGHEPTREQTEILLRPFDQFNRGVEQNLQERFEMAKQIQEESKKPKSAEKHPLDFSTVGILNKQGPENSKKIRHLISSFGPKKPKGGTRRKRAKRTKRTKRH
jgi:hypothetical protein